jgi:hypothetical protein
LFFALFSVAGLWLVWRIALALGASAQEALLALIFLLCSSTWTYYSRHLLPYDASMALALAAIWIALRRSVGWQRAGWAAIVAAAAFLTYYGSWAIVGFALLVCVFWRAQSTRDVLARASAATIGFVLPFALLVSGSGVPGDNLFEQYVAFAGTVTQGSYREGWSLPLQYFWHAEHGLAVLWAVCLALAVWHTAARAPGSRLALTGVVFIYAMLVVASVGFQVFVVYGRTARQLVPFLCLVAAQQVHRYIARTRQPYATAIVVALVAVQAAVNLATPLTQVFPDRFKDETIARAAGVERNRLHFVYADHIYPRPEPVDVSGATELARASHPLQFVPYHFEGFTPEERHLLRTTDISMRLLVR